LAFASGGDHLGVSLHHLHARPGQFLDERMTRHMIRMGMTRQENFDVREFEPQLLDVAPDDGTVRSKLELIRIWPLGRGDEISREPFEPT
jgi:hypothetical protein